MKRNDKTVPNQDQREYKLFNDEAATLDLIDHISKNSVVELREQLFQQLRQMDVEEIIRLFLEVLPAQVTPIYEAKLAERSLNGRKNKFFAVNSPHRSKEAKLVDLLNKLDINQLRDLRAKLPVLEGPYRVYM